MYGRRSAFFSAWRGMPPMSRRPPLPPSKAEAGPSHLFPAKGRDSLRAKASSCVGYRQGDAIEAAWLSIEAGSTISMTKNESAISTANSAKAYDSRGGRAGRLVGMSIPQRPSKDACSISDLASPDQGSAPERRRREATASCGNG